MKQTKLDIAPPLIERKCQWGTCTEDFAYCINGTDMCFAHGSDQLRALQKALEDLRRNDTFASTQLDLVKK